MNLLGRVIAQVKNIETKVANIKKTSAEGVYEGLKDQTVQLLEAKAEAWILENKLIHAGAARKLAREIMEKRK